MALVSMAMIICSLVLSAGGTPPESKDLASNVTAPLAWLNGAAPRSNILRLRTGTCSAEDKRTATPPPRGRDLIHRRPQLRDHPPLLHDRHPEEHRRVEDPRAGFFRHRAEVVAVAFEDRLGVERQRV